MTNDVKFIVDELGGTVKMLCFDQSNDVQLTLEQFGVTAIVVVCTEGFVCSLSRFSTSYFPFCFL